MRKLMMISALAVAATRMASADSFTINSDNLNGALCSALHPCGTVTVTGSSVLHVVASLNAGYGIFGNNDAFGFSTVGTNTGVTMSNFSSNLFDGTGDSGNEDGWGNFEFRVDGPGGSSAVQTLSFDVTRTGTPFTAPSNIEQGAVGSNGSGFTVFAMHVRNMQSGLTGFAGVTPVTPTPEPASLALLGLGGIAVGIFRKLRVRA